MDCGPPGSSVHGILPARILEWVAMPSSRGSSQPRDPTRISCSSCIAGGFFTAEPPGKSYFGYSTFQILLVRGVFRCSSERMLSIIWYILPIPAPLICCLWSQIWSLFLWAWLFLKYNWPTTVCQFLVYNKHAHCCFSHVLLFVILWTVAHQAPLSIGFSRQEYWSGLPCPPPGDLPNLGIKPKSHYVSCIGR